MKTALRFMNSAVSLLNIFRRNDHLGLCGDNPSNPADSVIEAAIAYISNNLKWITKVAAGQESAAATQKGLQLSGPKLP